MYALTKFDNLKSQKTKSLGYSFKNPDFLITALTHSSFAKENNIESYEKMEFLGDAILEFIISEYLYKERHLEEGIMTKMRASYVCETALATYARDLKFEEDIKLGSGESPLGANDTIMADVFEAFIAALYLDLGMDVARDVVLKIVVKYIENDTDFLRDYKSKLQELVQTGKQSVVYELVSETGPAHNKTFVTKVLVDGIVLGTGTGNSKKSSEQMAAREALSKQAR